MINGPAYGRPATFAQFGEFIRAFIRVPYRRFLRRRQIFNAVDGDFHGTVAISDIVVNSDTEVELSFDRYADLLVKEEAAVKGEFVECRHEV